MNPLHICLIIISSFGSLLGFISGIVFVVNYTCDRTYIDSRIEIKKLEIEKLKIQKGIAEEQHKHDQKMLGGL